MLKTIQKYIALKMGIISSLALFTVYYIPGRKSFFTTLIVWLIFLAIGEYFAHFGKAHFGRALPILGVTSLSFMGLVSLIEWRALIWILIVLGGITIFILYRTMVLEGNLIHIGEKPLRRFMMVMWVFDAYALITTFFAINLFFPKISFYLLTLLSGLAFSYISYMIWSMYYKLNLRHSWIWLLIIGLVMMELVWIMHLMPFGYLAAGLLVTWIWYVLQLFVRFHFSPKGIEWKKQRFFLASNLVFYAFVLLFFVRWV